MQTRGRQLPRGGAEDDPGALRLKMTGDAVVVQEPDRREPQRRRLDIRRRGGFAAHKIAGEGKRRENADACRLFSSEGGLRLPAERPAAHGGVHIARFIRGARDVVEDVFENAGRIAVGAAAELVQLQHGCRDLIARARIGVALGKGRNALAAAVRRLTANDVDDVGRTEVFEEHDRPIRPAGQAHRYRRTPGQNTRQLRRLASVDAP